MAENEELQRCIKILKGGGLIVAPTDTVYGLVCDATNDVAVKKLIALKNRPIGKPISVFVDGFEMMKKNVDIGSHESLLTSLLPGPFTVILPSKHHISPLLESERKTLGVRFTRSPWIQSLVALYGSPLTATSANLSGRPPHYSANGFIESVPEDKRHLIDYCVDGGKLPHNKPSTLIDLTGSSLTLLRKGDLLPISTSSFTTQTADETKKIANHLLHQHISRVEQKCLVFILEGEMGAGKTVFAQGLGEALGVSNVVSPTYVIYYEYQVASLQVRQFIHADLYNIEESNEFDHLGIESYLKPQTVVCIEWGNRMGPLFEKIKSLAHVVVVEISYVNEGERTISVKEL